MKLLSILLSLVVLVGCQRAHLEIFPDLKSAELMETKLTPKQMAQDIDALVAGALARHPDLADYADLDSLYTQVEVLKSELTVPMTRVEFFRVIGKLNADFADGHAFLIWPYQELNKRQQQGALTFPFAVKLTKNNQLAIAQDYRYQQKTISAGQVISKINGISTEQLLANLQHYVGGETKRLREHVIANRFPIMLWSVYGFIDEFELTLNEQTLVINKAQSWQSTENTAKEHYYKKLDGEVGYLYLGHFDIEPSEFEDFIDDSFKQIQQDKVTELVIDVRDNPGVNT